MEKRIRILVTGSGGDIGQSIMKILRKIESIEFIVGVDIHNKHAGIFLCNEFRIVPRVVEQNYKQEVERIIRELKINMICPVSEPELRHHLETNIFTQIAVKTKAVLITPNRESLNIGFDKLETSYFLAQNGLPFIESSSAAETLSPKFPVILKDRYGAGSKSVYIVRNQSEWNFYTKRETNLICQTYIPNAEEEYTCGLYSDGESTRTIIFRRELHGGYSGYGETVENDKIESLLIDLAELLKLQGSINVQLRLDTKGVPRIFEINPRFSSTVLFRHMLGFTDLVWAIEKSANQTISNYTSPSPGSKFYKGFSEFIFEPKN